MVRSVSEKVDDEQSPFEEPIMKDGQNILSGLRVIDCGTYIAGPAAATIMSDFGAEVIKIERPPYGDPYRRLSFLPGMPVSEHNYCWMLDARNKKSLALDLQNEAGREALRRLVATADVFITNYPPKLAEKLQVSYEAFAEINPRLIFAHITGYGEEGDDINQPGYDTTAFWARSGLTSMIYDLTVQTGATPCGSGDHAVSLALFGSIMLALYQRMLSGRGAKVMTSLMATGAWSNSCQIQAAMVGAKFPLRRPRLEALNPLVNQYQTRDGKRFMFCCIDTANDWGRVCRAIGRPELIDDPRFATAEARSQHSKEVVALLDEAIGSKEMAEWDLLFRQQNVVWGPIPTMEQVAADPQMAANGVFTELNHPQLGSIRTVSSPLNIQGVTKERPEPAPEVGEHTREILRSLGYST
jgi:crotonobetainyl-CoA:carnitine CoA-transferase CaiB-like acyl-CoA transferase